MASDPRDRIFAINQLLTDPGLRESLYADYTISFRHFAIGFFAHVFIVSRKYSFLDQAGLAIKQESRSDSDMPTWVPDCASYTAWRRAFINAIPTRDGPDAPNPYSWFPVTELQVYIDKASVRHVRELCPGVLKSNRDQDSILDPSIDPATGALHCTLTHLFVFEQHPVLLESWGSYHMYAVASRVDRSSQLCMLSWNQLQIQPGDHLFAFGSDAKYLVLRPKSTDNGDQSASTFELVTTRVALCKEKKRKDFRNPGNPSEQDWPRIMNLGNLQLQHSECYRGSSELVMFVVRFSLIVTTMTSLATSSCPFSKDYIGDLPRWHRKSHRPRESSWLGTREISYPP
jgi:hypothetical protein